MKHIIIFNIFLFMLSIFISCKSPTSPKESSPPDTTKINNPPDTTSHNFAWVQYTFGGLGGSSYFKDVAIVNDSSIWAVGMVYTDSGNYNSAHWDGRRWALKKIWFSSICGHQGKTIYPVSSIIAFNNSDIWITAGDQIVRGTDSSESTITCLPVSFNVNRLWGKNSDSIYAVGDGGNILFYVNNKWTKQEGGTTIDLRDIWGSSDGKTVWACGYSNDNFHSVLVKYENNQWHTIWQRDGSNEVPPFGYNVGSIWNGSSTYVTSSQGVFRCDTDTTEIKLSERFSGFTTSIRGQADNDIVVCGDDAVIWHYNGQNGKELNGGIQSQPLNACAIRENIIIAVGSDYSTFPNKALIYFGVRN